MSEKDTIFSQAITYNGVVQFDEFYRFCYRWLVDEMGLYMTEKKYKEQIAGNAKNLEIIWIGFKDVTDYFRFEIEIQFRIFNLTKVEMTKDNKKIKTNKGLIKMKTKGNLVRDYKGKFEKTAFQKFLRSIYEKWVIPARIEEYEGKLAEEAEEFISQAKSYLDLEGKR